jgi:uncharacterized protein YggE
MNRCGLTLILAAVCCAPVSAQPVRTIQAVGTATISATPDQVKVDIGVTTTGATAQDASSQNATLMTTVLAAVQQVLGPSADIKTIAFSITPNYKPQTSPPVIVGYSATNTIEVTSADMTSAAKVIDATTQAGATNINSLRFAISNDEAVREQALTAAAKQALAHAQAIAAGLGGHIGNVIAAQEGVTSVPLAANLPTASATPTPIVPGLVTVTANVTISAQLTQ